MNDYQDGLRDMAWTAGKILRQNNSNLAEWQNAYYNLEANRNKLAETCTSLKNKLKGEEQAVYALRESLTKLLRLMRDNPDWPWLERCVDGSNPTWAHLVFDSIIRRTSKAENLNVVWADNRTTYWSPLGWAAVKDRIPEEFKEHIFMPQGMKGQFGGYGLYTNYREEAKLQKQRARGFQVLFFSAMASLAHVSSNRHIDWSDKESGVPLFQYLLDYMKRAAGRSWDGLPDEYYDDHTSLFWERLRLPGDDPFVLNGCKVDKPCIQDDSPLEMLWPIREDLKAKANKGLLDILSGSLNLPDKDCPPGSERTWADFIVCSKFREAGDKSDDRFVKHFMKVEGARGLLSDEDWIAASKEVPYRVDKHIKAPRHLEDIWNDRNIVRDGAEYIGNVDQAWTTFFSDAREVAILLFAENRNLPWLDTACVNADGEPISWLDVVTNSLFIKMAIEISERPGARWLRTTNQYQTWIGDGLEKMPWEDLVQRIPEGMEEFVKSPEQVRSEFENTGWGHVPRRGAKALHRG